MKIADIAPTAAPAEAALQAASAAYYQAADLATSLAERATHTRSAGDLAAAVQAVTLATLRRQEFDRCHGRLCAALANR